MFRKLGCDDQSLEDELEELLELELLDLLRLLLLSLPLSLLLSFLLSSDLLWSLRSLSSFLCFFLLSSFLLLDFLSSFSLSESSYFLASISFFNSPSLLDLIISIYFSNSSLSCYFLASFLALFFSFLIL